MQTTKGFLSIFVLLATLSSCTYDYTRQIISSTAVDIGLSGETAAVTRKYAWRLKSDTPLWIAIPESELTPRQGYEVADLIYIELRKKFPLTDRAVLAANVDTALRNARVRQKPITIYPHIYRFESRLSSVSELAYNEDARVLMGRDRVGITLRAYNSYTGALIDVVNLSNRSELIDFSNGNIESLLPPLAAAYGNDLVDTPL